MVTRMFVLVVGFSLAAAPQSDAGVRLAWYEFSNLGPYGRFETVHVDQ